MYRVRVRAGWLISEQKGVSVRGHYLWREACYEHRDRLVSITKISHPARWLRRATLRAIGSRAPEPLDTTSPRISKFASAESIRHATPRQKGVTLNSRAPPSTAQTNRRHIAAEDFSTRCETPTPRLPRYQRPHFFPFLSNRFSLFVKFRQ